MPIHSKCWATCDICGAKTEEFESQMDLLKSFKDEGWGHIRQAPPGERNSEVVEGHICPRCVSRIRLPEPEVEDEPEEEVVPKSEEVQKLRFYQAVDGGDKYHKKSSCTGKGNFNSYEFTKEEVEQLHKDGRLCRRCVL